MLVEAQLPMLAQPLTGHTPRCLCCRRDACAKPDGNAHDVYRIHVRFCICDVLSKSATETDQMTIRLQTRDSVSACDPIAPANLCNILAILKLTRNSTIWSRCTASDYMN